MRFVVVGIIVFCFLFALGMVWVGNEMRGRFVPGWERVVFVCYWLALGGTVVFLVASLMKKLWLERAGFLVSLLALITLFYYDDVVYGNHLQAGYIAGWKADIERAVNHTEKEYKCEGGWTLALVRYPPFKDRDFDDLRWILLPPKDLPKGREHPPVDVMVRNYKGDMVEMTFFFRAVTIDVPAKLETCERKPVALPL